MKEDTKIQLALLWNEILNCSNNCEGINLNQNKGIIPRCLFFEDKDRDIDSEGCIVVGINPGISNQEERNSYIEMFNDKSIYNLWDRKPEHRYYKFLRKFLKNADLNGNILWTELLKCECEKGKLALNIPIQTYRKCVEASLIREIDTMNQNWIIVAVGREAHKALSYLFPKRTIIGVPHPTSSRGQFSKLFEGEKFNKVVKEKIDSIKRERGNSIWLTET